MQPLKLWTARQCEAGKNLMTVEGQADGKSWAIFAREFATEQPIRLVIKEGHRKPRW
jgi:hypothetical protein